MSRRVAELDLEARIEACRALVLWVTSGCKVVFSRGTFHAGSATVDASNIQPLPLEVGSLPSQSLRNNSPLKAYREGPQAWKPYNSLSLPSIRVFSRGV